MCRFFIALLGIFLTVSLPGAGFGQSQSFDVVINNGRVMDPEFGLDAVRHIGIDAGRIIAISDSALTGTREIDAGGLVVAPGFVDIHAHGQTEEAYRLMQHCVIH